MPFSADACPRDAGGKIPRCNLATDDTAHHMAKWARIIQNILQTYTSCVCICGFLLLGRYHQTWPPSSHISPIRAGPFSRSAPVPSAASLPAAPRVVIRMVWPANSQHFSVWYSLPHPLSHHYHHSPHLH